MTLYRPVGVKELDFRAFPPRLPIQPIFYPVLNFDYAAHIAREWNTGDPVSGYAGFVTQWELSSSANVFRHFARSKQQNSTGFLMPHYLEDQYAAQFEIQTVGARSHQELWVPVEQMDEFNAHIVGPIEVVASFAGAKFEGEIDPQTHLPLSLSQN